MADRGQPEISPQQTNAFTVVLRITWLLAGPVAAAFFVFFIGQGTSGVSMYDAGVGLALSVTLVARYVDIAFFRGETADGRPATLQDARLYAIKLVGGFGALWAIVRVWRGI